jgi:NDP-sugar pyrophosphorylase family protein
MDLHIYHAVFNFGWWSWNQNEISRRQYSESVILALAHEGKLIEDHVKKNIKTLDFPKIFYVYDSQDTKLLGTGGAIKNAQEFLDKEFMVIYGDSFLFIGLSHFDKIHLQSGRPLTLSIFKNQNLGDKSNVIFKNGNLLKYDKKRLSKDKEMEYIDYGLSYVNRDYFLKNTPVGSFDFSEFLGSTIEKKMATAYVANVMFHEIGSPAGYTRFLKLLDDNNFSLEKLRLLVK